MNNWKEIILKSNETLIKTMQVIDQTALQFIVVVDKENHVVGTVTDGDIRRAILKGLSLESSIMDVMNSKPYVSEVGRSNREYKKIMHENKLKQLPLVDINGHLQDILFSDALKEVTMKPNKVILMVGGLGTRLRPLTDNMPKPMLPIGGKPIVETIIKSFKEYGFTEFILSVNYKKEVIQDYFKNGDDFGVSIDYIEETKRLGTAGALSLITEQIKDPFIVMNGDLLTSTNFDQLLDFHKEKNSLATMCVREYEYQIPYGVIEVQGQSLKGITEKPIHRSFVNAGIYILNPSILSEIPTNEFYDMPDLFNKLVEKKENVSAFPIREYWLDIGQIADYEKAKNDHEVL